MIDKLSGGLFDFLVGLIVGHVKERNFRFMINTLVNQSQTGFQYQFFILLPIY